MDIVLALLIAVSFALALRNAIKAFPLAFYALAALIVVGFSVFAFGDGIPPLMRAAYPFIQRCLLAFGLFFVVMIIGVFPEASWFLKRLAPIRAELSLIATILAAGHVINYTASYLRFFTSGFSGASMSMLASFAVSVLLVAMLALLAITSIHAVRKRMSAQKWKRIQNLAYPFFALMYVHLALILGFSVSEPGQKAFVSIIVYTVVFGAYGLLRIRKARLDAASAAAMPSVAAIE